MTFVMFQPPEPTDAERIEAESDIALVHELMDTLSADMLYALNVVLRVSIAAPQRAIHLHGQVSTIMRVKYGLCHCGSNHKAVDHGAATAPKEAISPPYKPILDAYSVKFDEENGEVECTGTVGPSAVGMLSPRPCGHRWENMNERMLYNQCPDCGAGPVVK